MRKAYCSRLCAPPLVRRGVRSKPNITPLRTTARLGQRCSALGLAPGPAELSQINEKQGLLWQLRAETSSRRRMADVIVRILVRASFVFAVCWTAALACAGFARADSRVALVIGNSAYQHAGTLANPRMTLLT